MNAMTKILDAAAGRSRWVRGGALLVALACAGSPVAADWLVTKDGARIETRGPWKVDGRRVLFTLPNGTLSAIRSDEIDLDQSAVVTTEAKTPPAVRVPKEPVKKEPVLRLTEKDIPPSPVFDAEGEGENGSKEKAEDPTSALEVISWEKTEMSSGDGVEIFGTIRNNGKNMIVSPALLVAVYDADGGLLATNSGVVNSPQIAAGKTANFKVDFTGFVDFASAKFDAQGRGYKQNSPAAEGDEEGVATEDEGAYEEEAEPIPEIDATLGSDPEPPSHP